MEPALVAPSAPSEFGPAPCADRNRPVAIKAPDPSRPDLGLWLVGGNLWLAIVLPEEPGETQLATELPKILNAARVEPPTTEANRLHRHT